MGDRTTGDLVADAARGEQSAWNELVARFGRLVYAVARSFPLPPDERADVSQTVWLRFAEHLDRLRDPDRAGSWLAATTRNECLRLLRTSRRVVVTDHVDGLDEHGLPVDHELLRAERHAALLEAWALLPLHCQELLGLLYSDQRPSYAEVAQRIEKPTTGYIGPTRRRCLDHLRRELAGHDDAAPTDQGPDA